jgi:glycosyltransferase involved in cell wall biosynthesis
MASQGEPKRVAHVLWRSQGGIRRHVKTIAATPPCEWKTSAIWGPRELAPFFDGLPFVPVTRPQLLTAGGDADVIHAHGITAGIRAVPRHRPPVALSLHVVHGGSGRTASSGAAARVARFIVSRADAVIAVSKRGAVGFDGARIIPPAFDALPMRSRSRIEVRADLGAQESDVVMICVARLDSTKRLDLFIEAVEKARCVGWVVGDGPERERIGGSAAGTGVRMLGYRSDVADLLGAADVFALPSLSESYGIAVAEALQAGLPVVATDTGAIAELVGNAGIVVDAAETCAFVEALAELARDPVARAGFADVARGMPPIDTSARIAALGAVYDELYETR